MKKLLHLVLPSGKPFFMLFLFGLLANQTAFAQKAPLTHSVYDGWKEIPKKQLSPDGKKAVFVVNAQEGDGKLIVQDLENNRVDSIKRGAADFRLTADGKWLIFSIKPTFAETRLAKKLKKKKEEMPQDSLCLYDLANMKTISKVPKLKSFKIPEKAGAFVAFLSEKIVLDTAKGKKNAPKLATTAEGDEKPFMLTVRNFNDNTEKKFDNVTEYTFAKFGKTLLLTTKGDTTDKQNRLLGGVYAYDLEKKTLKPLFRTKKGKFTDLALDENGIHAAFLADLDTSKALLRNPTLFYANINADSAKKMADDQHNTMPKNWSISEHYTPLFSKNGEKLYFGTAPKPLLKDTSKIDDEVVNVEVWHYKDGFVQPQQKIMLEEDKKRSYLAVLFLKDKKINQIGKIAVPDIRTADEGNANVVLGVTNVPYRTAITWDISTFNDIYLYDLATGTEKLIAKKIKGNAAISPKGNYVTWFSLPDTAWFAYSIKSGQTFNISKTIKTPITDEENDMPDYPQSYGNIGFSTDEQRFYIYDRFDIWSLDVENRRAPINLTKIGRTEKIQFRYARLDPDEKHLDESKTWILRAFSETEKTSGYYAFAPNTASLRRLMFDKFNFSGLEKAKNADKVIFNRESFQEFGDIYASDLSFGKITKISDANPQQKNYRWGSVELVKWKSLDGIELEGLLYKPDNFDATKKYPMLTYFYEKSSDELYDYFAPAPIRSALNRAWFVSNGYLIFVPNIVYKTGYPGESAYNCIVSGVMSMIDKGFVDKDRLGIQGHSWGGYQTAYIVTKTNLFRAAEAGAIVSNMTSAYGGVRWETGLSRMFQYEKSQSRIGGTLWEKHLQFIENSPLFSAHKVQTPLLLLHNDDDGAVPWEQGIEFYMALRRLQKPVWMLNYNGEKHGVMLRKNRKDFSVRMYQFFDHYLKDAPAPAWLKNGIPYIEKGINMRLETEK